MPLKTTKFNPKMSAQETITKLNEQREAFILKLIEKYEAEITKIEDTINIQIPADLKYYVGKASCYMGFISDLKQLQQTL